MEDYEVTGIEGSRRTNLKYFKRKMNLPGADPGLPKGGGGTNERQRRELSWAVWGMKLLKIKVFKRLFF